MAHRVDDGLPFWYANDMVDPRTCYRIVEYRYEHSLKASLVKLRAAALLTILIVMGMFPLAFGGSVASTGSPTHRLGFWVLESSIMACTYGGGYQQCGNGHPAQLFFNSMFLTPPYPSSLEVMIFAAIQAETNNQGCSSTSSYIHASEAFWGDLATLAESYPNIQLIYEIAFDPTSSVYGVSCFQTLAQYFSQYPSVYGIGIEGEYSSGVSSTQVQQAMSAVAPKTFVNYYVLPSLIPSGGYDITHTNFPAAGDQVSTLQNADSHTIGIDSGYYYAFPFPQTQITCPIGPTAIVTGKVEGWNQCVEQTELATAVSMPPATRQFLELDVAWSSSGSFTGVSGQTTNQLWDSPTMRNWIWTDPNYGPNFILSTSSVVITSVGTTGTTTSLATTSTTSLTHSSTFASSTPAVSTSTYSLPTVPTTTTNSGNPVETKTVTIPKTITFTSTVSITSETTVTRILSATDKSQHHISVIHIRAAPSPASSSTTGQATSGTNQTEQSAFQGLDQTQLLRLAAAILGAVAVLSFLSIQKRLDYS